MNGKIRNAFNKKNYKNFYEELSYKYPEADITLESIEGRYRIKKILDFLTPYAQQNKFLLDAGCGNGIISIPYAKMGGQVVGIDIGSGCVEKARQESKKHGLNDKTKFLVRDISESLPFKNSTFDIVLCAEVIEHLLKPKIALDELKRVLKRGGILILTTPNPLAASKDIRRTMKCFFK